jgi:hypothetical protein
VGIKRVVDGLGRSLNLKLLNQVLVDEVVSALKVYWISTGLFRVAV